MASPLVFLCPSQVILIWLVKKLRRLFGSGSSHLGGYVALRLTSNQGYCSLGMIRTLNQAARRVKHFFYFFLSLIPKDETRAHALYIPMK